MLAEVITIGDELMTGHTLDSNAAEISARLTEIGIEVRYRSSIGDSVEAIEEAFQLALKRARLVICTGGLGPTDDDLTKRALVKVFRRHLIFYEEILDDIRQRYAKRGIEMPAINQNQALLPQGATFFPNQNGSAVGICMLEEGHTLIALPGVPHEMRQILDDEVVPYLKKLQGLPAISTIKLRTTGIVESALAEKINGSLRLRPGVKLAYLPGVQGVDLRIMAVGENRKDADEKAGDVARQIDKTAGKYVYGRDNDTLPAVVGQLLLDNDKTLAVAESCTGGLLGELITSIPGSSRYFAGGVVAYANEIKTVHLDVDSELLAQYGAVSEECAQAMAVNTRSKFGTDYALSITGIAGPEGGTDEKPVGTVYVGLASLHNNIVKLFNTGSLRSTNRQRAAFAALELLRRDILDIT